jgi:hypothetical protein
MIPGSIIKKVPGKKKRGKRKNRPIFDDKINITG